MSHIVRAFKIVLAVVLVLLALRMVTVPVPYGKFDLYQDRTVDYWVNKVPLEYNGAKSCKELACHGDETRLLASSRHHDISCETCHAVSVEKTQEGPFDCMVCHQRLRARPANFPQIQKSDHYPNDACVKCHNPHRPIPMMGHPMPVSRKGRQACLLCHMKSSQDEIPDPPVPGAPSEFEHLFKPPKIAFDHGGKRDCINCHTSTPSLAELATMVHGADISYCPRCHRAGGLAQGDFR